MSNLSKSLLTLVLTILLLTPPTLAANKNPSTRPTSQPADNPDPDFQKGRALARKDLQANTLGEILPIPEVFLLEWMDPQSEEANLVEYYQAVVLDKYGVKVASVMFNAASPDRRMFALGYNHEMRPHLEKRCGPDTLNELWKRACDTSSANRAQYLKARAAQSKGTPTTQPSKPNR